MTVTGWGNWTELTVEIDLSQSTSIGDYTPDPDAPLWLWDSGIWDDTASVWQAGVTWTDVTADVRSFNSSASFERQNDAFNASTAQIVLDNRSGDYSPDNTASPYRVGGVTTIGMWRAVRVSGTYAADGDYGNRSTFPIFAGYVRAWNEEFPEYGKDAVVSVDLVDAFGKIAAFDGFAQTPIGAGELSGARIARILNNAGVLDANRYLDAGTVTMQATTLEGNALSEMKLVADSEGGAVWCGPDGGIYFDNQRALIEKDRSRNWLLYFSDTGDTGSLAYESIETSYDGDLVTNIAAYQRVGGAVQVSTSPSSRSVYGDRQESRTDLVCETDAQASLLANKRIALRQQAERRIESLTFKPNGQNTDAQKVIAWNALLGFLQMRALCLVILTPPAGDQLQRLVFVSGISHTITADDWTIGLSFTSATEYIGYFGSLWDAGFWDGQDLWAW